MNFHKKPDQDHLPGNLKMKVNFQRPFLMMKTYEEDVKMKKRKKMEKKKRKWRRIQKEVWAGVWESKLWVCPSLYLTEGLENLKCQVEESWK
jgi:hypothetical protein